MASAVLNGNQPAPEYDRSLAWAALLLVTMGLVMVYSASIATAEASRFSGHNPAYFLLRHGAFLAVSLAAATAVFMIPARLWQNVSSNSSGKRRCSISPDGECTWQSDSFARAASASQRSHRE